MRRRLNPLLLAALLAAGVSPIRADTATVPPPDSLYRLHAALRAENGSQQRFDLDRGHPTLISMFYGGCPASCPMLITGLQVYERQLPTAARARLRVLLVSFDATHDTPPRLAALAREHRADPRRWCFTSASETDARKIAALLGIKFRQLSDGGYDHTLLITLLDGEGRPLARTSKLIGDTQFQSQLQAATESEP